MTDFSFLKLFNSELDKDFTAYEINQLSNLSKQITDIKLDSLLSKDFIKEHRIEELFKGENFSVSTRWLEEDREPSEHDRLFVSTYSLTNAGLQYFEDEKFKIETELKRTKREWFSIIISLISITIAIIAFIISMEWNLFT